jgi:hypothetical protein
MKAVTKFLGAGVAIAALAGAAPAAAQYYPGYGSPAYGYPGYGYPSGGAGAYGYPGYGYPGGGYGYNVPGGSRIAASQCSAAVQQRLGGYGGGYGYGGGGGRVLGINSVEIRSNGGYRVRGVASVGGYGYGGGGAIQFTCRTDPRGFVTNVDLNNRYGGNGYYGNGYYGQNTNNPYSVYGYQRY